MIQAKSVNLNGRINIGKNSMGDYRARFAFQGFPLFHPIHTFPHTHPIHTFPMCGITGVFLADSHGGSANSDLFEGLGMLQHRGQDAAGIVTCGARGRLYQCKGNGMVRDVFTPPQLLKLMGSMGIGHVRYPTAGTSSMAESQPFYVNSPYGLASAHNGNLTNTEELRKFLDETAHRHVNTDSDSEVLLNIFAEHLQQTQKRRVNEEDIFAALGRTFEQVRGGYACVTMIAGFGIFGFRDPHGLRPLIYGSRVTPAGTDYMFASESVVLDSLGFSNFCDVGPGEAIIITKSGVQTKQCTPALSFTPCIFEYVYFARPDSIIDHVSVYKARLAMGEALAKQVVKKLGKDNDIDVVIPVPDTSRSSALEVSYKLGKVYREGFVKNRYIARTFIMPGQTQRIQSVRRKLNPMPMEFAGKVVLLVDDSIVRGTTSKEIISMAREAGAKKVYFASCAPAIRFPNVYGIDMPTRQELVAFNRNDEEIADAIGADEIIFQDLDDMIESVSKFNPSIKEFDVSVFTGCYVTGDIDEQYFKQLEYSRSQSAKNMKVASSHDVLGLFNNVMDIVRK